MCYFNAISSVCVRVFDFRLRNGVKQCELIRLPEILCIHLKRFRHDSIYNTKVSTKVTFPLCDLDLRPFVRPSVLEKNERMVTEYDLVAIISHHGGSVDCTFFGF